MNSSEQDLLAWQQNVRAAYLGLLKREPDEYGQAHFVASLQAGVSYADILGQIVGSREFLGQGSDPTGCTRSEAMRVFEKFDRYAGPGRDGMITNFVGASARTSVVDALRGLDKIIEDYPIPGNFHGETLEWMGVLQAVLDAQGRFRMIELGAGWAPWCATGFVAARQRNIRDVQLVAVEGDVGHVAFIHETMEANGIKPHECKVVHGVVGLDDGVAYFPTGHQASHSYGAVPKFKNSSLDFDDYMQVSGATVRSVDEVPSFSLRTIMDDRFCDLIHCDVQGGEGDLLEANIDLLSARLRRIVVGTHSAELDRRLATLFGSNGWTCEGLDGFATRNGVGYRDGCQVWRNPRL